MSFALIHHFICLFRRMMRMGYPSGTDNLSSIESHFHTTCIIPLNKCPVSCVKMAIDNMNFTDCNFSFYLFIYLFIYLFHHTQFTYENKEKKIKQVTHLHHIICSTNNKFS